jgi:ribosomal-protein-alanine N-acetyltransferase
METIATERLLLTKFTPEIYHEIFTTVSEVDAKRLLGESGTHCYAVMRKRWEAGLRTHNRSFVFFQIRERATDRIIGGGGFHNWATDMFRAELGYALEQDNDKRKGYMTEALSVIVPYGFNVLQIHRMEALIGPENIASQKLVMKWGFKQEGHLREHFLRGDVYEDSLVFGLLRNEWNGNN